MSSSATLSEFAQGLKTETAFDVLAVAKRLKSQGKDVVELQIGDSPFSTTSHAKQAGIQAIEKGQTHYCPSQGLPDFREAIAENYSREMGVSVGPENVVVGAVKPLLPDDFTDQVQESFRFFRETRQQLGDRLDTIGE